MLIIKTHHTIKWIVPSSYRLIKLLKQRIESPTETLKGKQNIAEQDIKYTQLLIVIRNRKIPHLILNEDIWCGL